MAGITSSPGNTSAQLMYPWGIYVSVNYTLYIVDQGNHRVQKWERGELYFICNSFSHSSLSQHLGAANATTIAGQTGVPGGWSYQFSSPTAITFDQYGNMYVMDSGNNRIQQWWPGSTYGVTVVAAGFSNPRGIAFDPSGNFAIADYSYARVVLASVVCRK